VIYGDSFAIRPISSMKYIFGLQLFEKLLMKYSEACEKILNSYPVLEFVFLISCPVLRYGMYTGSC